MDKDEEKRAVEDLANEIVRQTADDYRKALRAKKHGVQHVYINGAIFSVKNEITRCEAFFKGEWIKLLTKVKGKYIMNRIQEEIEHEETGGR